MTGDAATLQSATSNEPKTTESMEIDSAGDIPTGEDSMEVDTDVNEEHIANDDDDDDMDDLATELENELTKG
jgi:hypothetical protein